MNGRDLIEIRELLERINQLIAEYVKAPSPERLAFLEVEILG